MSRRRASASGASRAPLAPVLRAAGGRPPPQTCLRSQWATRTRNTNAQSDESSEEDEPDPELEEFEEDVPEVSEPPLLLGTTGGTAAAFVVAGLRVLGRLVGFARLVPGPGSALSATGLSGGAFMATTVASNAGHPGASPIAGVKARCCHCFSKLEAIVHQSAIARIAASESDGLGPRMEMYFLHPVVWFLR